MMDEQLLWTADQASEQLKLTPGQVRRMASRDEMPHVHLPNREIRFSPTALRQWLERLGKPKILPRAADTALDACRLLTQWAADRADLPDGLDVIVRAAWDAILAGDPRCYKPER